MCWNATISLNTFALACFGMCFAYVNKYKGFTDNVWGLWAYIALLSFAIMQLLEALIWLDLARKSRYNTLLSILGFALITLQPLISILQMTNKKEWKPIMLVLYTLFVIAVYLLCLGKLEFKSVRAENVHQKRKCDLVGGCAE